jgi:hypothetical protein
LKLFAGLEVRVVQSGIVGLKPVAYRGATMSACNPIRHIVQNQKHQDYRAPASTASSLNSSEKPRPHPHYEMVGSGFFRENLEEMRQVEEGERSEEGF